MNNELKMAVNAIVEEISRTEERINKRLDKMDQRFDKMELRFPIHLSFRLLCSPVFGRSHTIVSLEQPAEVELVFKADRYCHFFDIAVFVFQHFPRFGHSKIVNTGVDAAAGFFLEDTAQIAGA